MGTSKKVTTGYRYYMGLHMGLCYGPVDAMLKIKVGDREAWSGTVTSSSSIYINAPDLFGGEEREGGVQGTLDVMMGEKTQQPNNYLISKQQGHQPAYRGLLGAVFRGGLVSCMNPYVKPWTFKLRRILQGWQGGSPAWYPEKAAVTLSSGDIGMNPAHIYYECLTNQDWGMAYGSAQVNDANFRAAADLFHSEGLGLCIKWTKQTQIKDFLQVISDHAGANIRQNKRTGLFEIKPIRADYDAQTLELFDESKIVDVESFQRPGITDSVNELKVGYVDVTTGKDGSVTVQNLANITAQGGVVAKTQTYPGIPTADLAIRTALRDLNAISTPIAKLRLKVDRNAWSYLPGDVIRLSWAKLGITDMVLRILRISGGTKTSGAIMVEAAEDVFGLPSAGYAQQQPVGWTDPNTLPAPATNRITEEMPFYALQQRIGTLETNALANDAGYLSILAVRPSSDSIDYAIFTSSGSGYSEASRGDFCPSAVLVAGIDPDETAITLESIVDGDIVTVGGFAYLGDEIVRIDAFDYVAGTATIGRGVMDSVAQEHVAGERLYFADNYLDSDDVERIDGETLQVKLLPKTGRGQLDEAQAPADQITFDQRQFRPYPPGRMRINTLAYPTTIEADEIAVSWTHRDRLQQNLEGDESLNIGPEAGTTYTVRLLDASNASVIQTHSGISTNNQVLDVLSPGQYSLTVELWSVRDGLDSRQKHQWSFDYTRPEPSYDPYWNNVVSLIHFDGTNGSTIIIDEKSNTWTAENGAALSTTSPIFGTASLLVNGDGTTATTNQSCISTPINANLDITSGDFTVEFFITPQATPSVVGYIANHFAWQPTTERSWAIVYRSTNKVAAFLSEDGVNTPIIEGVDTVAIGTTTHIALVRSGSTFSLFVGGVLQGQQTIAGALFASTAPVLIGAVNPTRVLGFNGKVDEFRITKGVARYSANFTPPVEPFPHGA